MHERPLRQQLFQARGEIQREIDDLRTPAMIGYAFLPNPKKVLIETLKAKLKEIDEALDGLGQDDA
jgi:hypothetical protein